MRIETAMRPPQIGARPAASADDGCRSAAFLFVQGRYGQGRDRPKGADGRARIAIHRTGKTRMNTGTVKWFNAVKGYGFISPDDGSKDAFVHISAVERAGLPGLSEGQRVSYELQRGKNGKSAAANLKLV